MYVKIFGSILYSSVWAEDHATVRVWITLLVLADATGFVRGAPSGIANAARVTHTEFHKAIKVLSEPDLQSGHQDYGGRRIEPVEGGWLILNYEKYREMRTSKQVQDAKRQARARARKRAERDESRDAATSRVTPAHADADAVSETEVGIGDTTDSDSPETTTVVRVGDDPLLNVARRSMDAKDLGSALDRATKLTFGYFRAAWGKTGRYLLSDDRHRRLRKRVQEAYDAARADGLEPRPALIDALSEAFYAIDGSKLDHHIRNHRQFQTIEIVLRDRGQVERFRDLIAHRQPVHPTVQQIIENGSTHA